MKGYDGELRTPRCLAGCPGLPVLRGRSLRLEFREMPPRDDIRRDAKAARHDPSAREFVATSCQLVGCAAN